MSYVEMVIDSIRHAMHKDEWVILLKEKAGQRCLPVYVDKVWADAVGKALRDEVCDEGVDDKVEKALAMGGEVVLMIDKVGDSFKARFVGQGDGVECPVGKGLALCAKASGKVFVEEAVLEEVGIATQA